MHEHNLIAAYKAMMYVARAEEIELDKKYEELDDTLLNSYDLDIVDMVDNMEVFYNLIKRKIKIN